MLPGAGEAQAPRRGLVQAWGFDEERRGAVSLRKWRERLFLCVVEGG
jgi:hypothetical protein